jgi:hypothetical protein
MLISSRHPPKSGDTDIISNRIELFLKLPLGEFQMVAHYAATGSMFFIAGIFVGANFGFLLAAIARLASD